MTAQINLTDKIHVDLFAGGGGWSTGFALATGHQPDIAVNHSEAAILMHRTNHPWTEHYQEDVFAVDPMAATRGRPVGWLHASPDCKHFSRAKGKPLVDQKIRGLAWVVLRWADQVRPDIISIENVPEFVTWGPLIPTQDGKGETPDPERAGETFSAFVGMLTSGVSPDCPAIEEMCKILDIERDSDMAQRLIRGLGYTVDWRELVAADYGGHTSRKRLFIIARSDGKPIVWPEPTHAKANSREAKSGQRKPWRAAAEILESDRPCPSIFATKSEIREQYGIRAQRPLRDNTMQRIARGLDEFVIKAAKPFIIQQKFKNRPQSVDEPVTTVTAVGAHEFVDALMSPWTCTNTSNSKGAPADEPVHTVTSAGNQMLMAANLLQYHTEQTERVRGQALDQPIMTIDASPRYALESVFLSKYYSGCKQGQAVDQPLHTVTTKDREGLTAVYLSKLNNHDGGASVDGPLATVTAGAGHHALVSVRVVKAEPGANLHRWPLVRDMLNAYCGYTLAEDDILLRRIGDGWYFIADVGLRMLTPRELFRAHDFPEDYIIDHDYKGNVYKKSEQVARVGNSVPPTFPEAIVPANAPELCAGGRIPTMEEFGRRIAVRRTIWPPTS